MNRSAAAILCLATLCLAAPQARAGDATGFLPEVTTADLLGQWKQTKSSPGQFTPGHSYFTFTLDGGKLRLRAGMAAAVWSENEDRTEARETLETAVDESLVTLDKGTMTITTVKSCGTLHADGESCSTTPQQSRHTIQIFRQDVFDFDLLILDGDKPAAQRWFYRMPVKPSVPNREAGLLANWYIKGWDLYTTSSLRLYHIGRKGFRYRMIIDAPRPDGSPGLSITGGNWKIDGKKLLFDQQYQYSCAGVWQDPVTNFESIDPVDLTQCQGGASVLQYALPFTAKATSGKSSKLTVELDGRAIELTGIPL